MSARHYTEAELLQFGIKHERIADPTATPRHRLLYMDVSGPTILWVHTSGTSCLWTIPLAKAVYNRRLLRKFSPDSLMMALFQYAGEQRDEGRAATNEVVRPRLQELKDRVRELEAKLAEVSGAALLSTSATGV